MSHGKDVVHVKRCAVFMDICIEGTQAVEAHGMSLPCASISLVMNLRTRTVTSGTSAQRSARRTLPVLHDACPVVRTGHKT